MTLWTVLGARLLQHREHMLRCTLMPLEAQSTLEGTLACFAKLARLLQGIHLVEECGKFHAILIGLGLSCTPLGLGADEDHPGCSLSITVWGLQVDVTLLTNQKAAVFTVGCPPSWLGGQAIPSDSSE